MESILLTTIFLSFVSVYGSSSTIPDPEMPVPELISYWGYPVEEHWVTTEDGYILGLHRIPRGRDETGYQEGPRPVVYCQHGMTHSSSSWTFGPPEKSLGYVLSDAGYDVWMMNNRGNFYSRNHTTLEVCSDERCQDFWDFSWHEIGIFDVTAGIDYVLEITGQKEVSYVGHSMGCTQYLVAMSLRPEYNEKIKIGIMLAPVAFMTHATSLLFSVSAFGEGIGILFHLFGRYEFAPYNDLLTWIGRQFCSDDTTVKQDLCENVGFALLGGNTDYLDESMIPTYLDHFPQGTSTRALVHYAQLHKSGNFEAYDFGVLENILRYQQPTPLVYDLSKVVAPMAIFKADNDELVNNVDVDNLVNHLPNVVFKHLVEREEFGHNDYIMGLDADIVLNPLILDVLSHYNV